MSQYYVDKEKQPEGDVHMVHISGCVKLPPEYQREALGDFSSCEQTLTEAKQTYPKVNGCYDCSYSCHRSL
ncbi:hypothetical protein COU15_02580 [Candidatus Kaiserbacteria bacterium CG10_big_fil_rev_8_21_14_0_10_45_20]|uniref:Uncharacterized protein n=1 Tax=Candidatus Kaiserbacteria bacterium CG10_big_fil_rev_8_21_14_0_10_45_20 TaxID=1974607 RepID=A0A2H0UHF9_9BACT|nr:MAG: hypothetical protein COU15_02580 [Candidatus Kaiserbacteria bacterium CG10_big_fil_rev_8_21_14_0_10_45_20]